jgi:transposase
LKRQLSNAVNSRHARIILLSRGGICNREIAERVGCSPQWVRRIIHRFNHGGVEAIVWYPYWCHAREPRKFLTDTIEQIGEVAHSPPRQLIGMSVWSLSKLRDYLVEQGIVDSIAIEWLRQILRRHKIHWRHTKTWKDSEDPEFGPKYRRIRWLYGHRPPGGIRLCVDEFGPLNLLPRHGMHYARTGHVDRLRATYRRTGGVRHFMGVYDLESDRLTGYFVKKKNRKIFLSFLRWLRRRYRHRGILHIVLDNATYHSRPEILEYARENDIHFYWTPTNASWLNRIECQFTALRKFTLDNTDYSSHDEMHATMFDYLAWRNRRRDISIQNWPAFRRRRAA